MRSRMAPRVERQLQLNDPAYQPRQAYDLKKEELDEIRKEKMYPFYDKDSEGRKGDLVTEINDNSAQVQKQLNFLLPFFGFGFNYTWVIIDFYTFKNNSSSIPIVVQSNYITEIKILCFIFNGAK